MPTTPEPTSTGAYDLDAAHYALQHRLITQAQLDECLRIARELSASGLATGINQILVDKRMLSQGQLNFILQTLGKPLAEVDQYEILSSIGKGGMGTVYKVRHKGSGKSYAMKVLKQNLAGDREKDYKDRFMREVNIAVTLDHPNIASSRDFGLYKGLPYYVMDYVEGDLLENRITARGRIAEQESAGIAIQVARALAYAHDKHLVHRDVKPTNIMIATDGTVKLLDLGVAKSTDSGASLTLAGFIVGSPHFLSPEQARCDQKLDIRSDIYSLGATLFTMVTGKRPFDGPDNTAIVLKRLNEDPPVPSQISPEISQTMSSAILKMMARDIRLRYQTPQEVIAALDPIARGAAAAVKPPPAANRSPDRATRRIRRPVRYQQHTAQKFAVFATAIAAIVLAAIILVPILSKSFGSTPDRVPVVQRPLPKSEPPVIQPTPPHPMVVPPVTREPPKAQKPEPPPTSPVSVNKIPGLPGRLVFSSQDRSSHKSDLYAADISNGTVKSLIATFANEILPVCSPDGNRIAFECNSDPNPSQNERNWEIFVMNSDGKGAKNLTQNNVRDAFPSWSPDGRRIVFESDRNNNRREIFVMNSDGTNVKQLTRDATSSRLNRKPSWSPLGDRVAYMSGELGRAEITVMNSDGTGKKNITNHPSADDGPAYWSPDGSKLAFASNRDGDYEIYTMNADGTSVKKLTNNQRMDDLPVWSPDGKKIAFVSDRDGPKAIYIMDSDGGNTVRVTNNRNFDVQHPAWSK